MLQTVDDALRSAAEAEKKTSDSADKALKNAVNMLSEYERISHPASEEAVAARMEKAKKKDKSSLKASNRLKESFRVREEPTL